MTEPAPASSAPPGNPYPGLRPFRRDEALLFFGRSAHVGKLLEALGNHRFLAVLGSSGSGKSSLVLAGLMPAVEAGLAGENAGYDWVSAECRPGDDPLFRLADCLAHLEAEVSGKPQRIESDRALLRLQLDRSRNPLAEFRNRCSIPPGTNLLLLVDQFEELFRFRDPIEAEQTSQTAAPPAPAMDDKGSSAPTERSFTRQQRLDDAGRFIDMLLEALSHENIYIVLTMRSEYLGDCAKFPGLAEAINQSHYLTPRLTREQMEDAIAKPAALYGGSVQPALVNRLYFDAGASSDQLPLLQHTLARMWNLLPPGADRVLTLESYLSDSIGTLAQCLDKHADSIYNALTPERQRIVARLFRTLTERGRMRRDTRRMCRVSEVAALVTADRQPAAASAPVAPEPDPAVVEEVIQVADLFRDPAVTMLRPEMKPGEKLTADDTLDITHESVARQWKRLREQWIPWEAQAVQGYLEYSGQAGERLLPLDDPLFGKRFFTGKSMRVILRYPQWVLNLSKPLARKRRQMERIAAARRTFRDHLDDFALRTAVHWRDTGWAGEDSLLAPAPAKKPAPALPVADPDPLPKSAVWASRYDPAAAETFPRSVEYINESEVRRANEAVVRALLVNVARFAAFLIIVAAGVAVWAMNRASSAEGRIAIAESREKTATQREEGAVEKLGKAVEKAREATDASGGAHLMLAEGSWREGRFLDALPQLAKAREYKGDEMPPILADELPPPVEFSYRIEHSFRNGRRTIQTPRTLTASPDGKWLAAVFTDGGLELFETATGTSGGVLAPGKTGLRPENPSYSDGFCFLESGLLRWAMGRLTLHKVPELTPVEPPPAWLRTMQAYSAAAAVQRGYATDKGQQGPPAYEKREPLRPLDNAPADMAWCSIMVSGDGTRLVGLLPSRDAVVVPLTGDGVPFAWDCASPPGGNALRLSGAAISQDGTRLVASFDGGFEESRLAVAALGNSPGECQWLCPLRTAKAGANLRELAVDPFQNLFSHNAGSLRFAAMGGKGDLHVFYLKKKTEGKQPVFSKEAASSGKPVPADTQWTLEEDEATPPPPVKSEESNAESDEEPGGDAGGAMASASADIRGTRLAIPTSGAPLIALQSNGQLRCWWGFREGGFGEWPKVQVVHVHESALACTISPRAEWIATSDGRGITRLWKVASESDRLERTERESLDWAFPGWNNNETMVWAAGNDRTLEVLRGTQRSRSQSPVTSGLSRAISSATAAALGVSLQEGVAIYATDPARPVRVVPFVPEIGRLDSGDYGSLSPSGKRYLIHPSGGVPAVFDTESGREMDEWKLPETGSGKFEFGHDEDSILFQDTGKLLVYPRGGAPQPLETSSGKTDFIPGTAQICAQGRRVVAFVHDDGAVGKRKCAIWSRGDRIWEVRGFPLKAGVANTYGGGGVVRWYQKRVGENDFAFSPSGSWLFLRNGTGLVSRVNVDQDPGTEEELGREDSWRSFAISDEGEVLVTGAHGRVWRRKVRTKAMVSLVGHPAVDWRPVDAEAAEKLSGLELQDKKFHPVPASRIKGQAPASWPADSAESAALWLAAERSFTHLDAFSKSLANTDGAVNGNDPVFALSHWLKRNPDHLLRRVIAKAWSTSLYEAVRDVFPDEGPGETVPGTVRKAHAAGLQVLAGLAPDAEFLRLIRARQIAYAVALGDDSAAALLQEKDTPELAAYAFAFTARTMRSLPLQLMTVENIADDHSVSLVTIVAKLLPDWRGPWLQTFAALPKLEDMRAGPHWQRAASLAAEAVKKLEMEPDCNKALTLRAACLLAGRLALLADDHPAAEPLLRKAAGARCIVRGHRETKAFALALLGEHTEAEAALIPPSDLPPEKRPAADPLFRALIEHLKFARENPKADPAGAVEAIRLLKEAKSKDGKALAAFFAATPELSPLSRLPEFREEVRSNEPQSRPPSSPR